MDSDRETVSLDDIDRAPTEIPSTQVINYQEKFSALLVKFTDLSDQHFVLKEKHVSLKAQSATRSHLDDLIKPYACKIFVFMCFYSLLVGVFVTLDGFHFWSFKLPEHVLDLLVGSTGVTILGLVGVVLSGIFKGDIN